MQVLDFTILENKRKRLDEIPAEYLTYIKSLAKKSKYYPKYHIAPQCGLMNDPNGLVQIDGWYHIFYQWFPLGPVHGLKHWYHVKTRDFMNYIDMGVAMFPENALDKEGCYSGMMTPKGEVYYTGVDENMTQNVIKASFLQDKIIKKEICVKHSPTRTTRNFRDPFVFSKEGKEYMMVGAEDLNNIGRIDLYENIDGDFINVGFTDLGNENLGFMLECPNLISCGGKDVLVFSPQGIQSPDKFTYRNVFSVAYAIGNFDVEKNVFQTKEYIELDKGFDFYAPQIFTDQQGRQIMFAWFGNSKCIYPSDSEQWAHLMTLPRELKLQDGILVQVPLEELKALRGARQEVQPVVKLESLCFELELEVEGEFSIKIKNNIEEYICFSANNIEYSLDRSHMTHRYNENFGNVRYEKRIVSKETIRVFVDRSTIEIFANDYKTVFTSRFYLDDIEQLELTNCQGFLYSMEEIKMEK